MLRPYAKDPDEVDDDLLDALLAAQALEEEDEDAGAPAAPPAPLDCMRVTFRINRQTDFGHGPLLYTRYTLVA